MPKRGIGLAASACRAIADELTAAPHGKKTATARRLASYYGCSIAQVYRAANRVGLSSTSRPRPPQRPELREWAQILLNLSMRAPGRQIPLDICLEAAVAEGLLPVEAGRVHRSTYYRVLRELGGGQTKRRNRRLHAERPMQAVLIDASTSEYLMVERQLEDGDYLLRLHRRPYPAGGYKNKPLGRERLRVLVYSIWDMATGYQLSRYTVARGESGLDACEFLCWAMADKTDSRLPFHGIPEALWSDQGPLVKNGAALDLVDRLGIAVIVGEPYKKERMGGVERTHRTRWQRFEASLFLRNGDYITLSELDTRLVEYLVTENERPARYAPALSRTDAWIRGVNHMGGVRSLPERPMETLAKEVRRWCDQSGIIRWDNRQYEVPKIHRRWVIARRAVTDTERVVVEDVETGERFDAQPFSPMPYGEFRGRTPEPLRDKAAKAGQRLAIHYDPFARATDIPTNIIQLPPRAKPAMKLDDPLETRCYPDLSTAMQGFFAIADIRLTEAQHQAIAREIEKHRLDKAFVAELALNIVNHQEEQSL